MSIKEKSKFGHFFKEDSEVIQDVIKGGNGELIDKVGLVAKEVFPTINTKEKAPIDVFNAQWRTIRAFFRKGKNSQGLAEDLSPVITAPLYTKGVVGTDFPVWVADENFDGEGGLCLSFKDMILRGLNKIAPKEEDAFILKSNVARIMNIANEQLSKGRPQLFLPAMTQIFDTLTEQFEVSGDDAKVFTKNISRLKRALPQNGILLPYTNDISFQLLDAALGASLRESRKGLNYDVFLLKNKLKELLKVEEDKTSGNANSGGTNALVNFGKISSMMPDSGTESMGDERYQRIKAVVEHLEVATTILNEKGFLFIDETLYNNENIDWTNLFVEIDVETYSEGKGCDALCESFEGNIETWTKFFIAKRIGELEVQDSYQSDIHDDYFEHFNWRNFSKEELNNCPHFVLIADDVQLFNTELNKLSSVLASNIPVKVAAVKRDNFGAGDSADIHAQTELGALMLSHKNIYVAQSTSITPQYLFKGYQEGLAAFAPAFFYVLNVDRETHENPYLWTSATIESRDFPGFTFNGMLGSSWGTRFNVENNPQPNRAYPIHKLDVENETGEKIEMEFPFTFADLAVLNPAYHNHFMLVDASFWNENLIPLTEYMNNSFEENIGNIPFVWMMNAENELQKVAVSWSVVLATQERLDFWRFLQENSGINNYHVKQAVAEAKAEMQKQHDMELEDIKVLHEVELKVVREEEAGRVMENLTSVLLSLDTSSVVTTSATPVTSNPTPSAQPVADKTVEAVVETAAVEEDDDMLSNDPYIDTVLCTSCNECLNLNGQMFKYNTDKMAFIADAKAGTFNELVEAAEMCPVEIIHPGSPLNPDEPNLEDLIERAAKFN